MFRLEIQDLWFFIITLMAFGVPIALFLVYEWLVSRRNE
jgi:hypothetical protein